MIDDRELELRLHAVLGASSGLAAAKGAADLRRYIKAQPEVCLVGATAAANLLGIAAPHIARLRKKERMPTPIPVDGGYPVYLRSEVLELARELESERACRAGKAA